MLESIRTVEPGLKTERKDARLQRRKSVQVSVFWLCALAFLRFPFHEPTINSIVRVRRRIMPFSLN